jgi:TonB family protein
MKLYKVVPVLVALSLTGCAVPPRPLRVEGYPWPKDSQGHYAEGTTMVAIRVNHHGVATHACIDQSSGNIYLDQIALSRVQKDHYTPSRLESWPAEGYGRQPIVFSLSQKKPESSVAISQHARPFACTLKVLPGVSKEEVALDEPRSFTVAPDEKGRLPIAQNTASWPIDSEGKPLQLDQRGMVLVDPSGKVLDARFFEHSPYPEMDKSAYYKMLNLSLGAQADTHWEIVTIELRAEGGGTIMVPGKNMPPPPPSPSPQIGQTAGDIRFTRIPGRALAGGKTWPQSADGTYLRAIINVRLWIDSDGKLVYPVVDKSAAKSPFAAEAYNLALKHTTEPATGSAHWTTLKIDFWPIPSMDMPGDGPVRNGR